MIKFKVGQYNTREGMIAFVRFIVQQPTNCIYVLLGESQQTDGTWIARSWTVDGRNTASSDGAHDLVLPIHYVYSNIYKGEITPWTEKRDADDWRANSCLGVLRLGDDGSLKLFTLEEYHGLDTGRSEGR